MSEPVGQGEIWTVTGPLGRTRTVVVLDTSAMMQQGGLVVTAGVHEAREVPSKRLLLSIPIPGTSQIVGVYDIAVYPKNNFTKLESVVPPETLELIKGGLRARFDL